MINAAAPHYIATPLLDVRHLAARCWPDVEHVLARWRTSAFVKQIFEVVLCRRRTSQHGAVARARRNADNAQSRERRLGRVVEHWRREG